MESSDDEADIGPKSVSEYHFVDDEQDPISFSVLPLQWDDGDVVPGDENGGVQEIFLRGAADRGLQKVFKPVKAWKFDLSNAFAEISVLTKDNSWIKLLKPRKSFEEIIRSTLITVQFLHLVKRSPDTSQKLIWDNLSKTFSTYEVRPSQEDLIDHTDLISEAVSRDDSLKRCKFLLSFLEEKPRKKTMADKDKETVKLSGFLVDDADEGILEAAEEEDDSNDDLFDSVCAFCDNGGEILCCEGKCMRAFHATVEAGEESDCQSLGLTKKEVDEMQNFVCKNCEYEQHQCFACGNLGCSKKSSDAEVFRCANATCGYFYHPQCVAKLLQPGDKVAAEELENKIAARETFLCPIHKCHHCNQGENKQIMDLQFAVCRRCPIAYHRKCLPKEIRIAKDDDEADDGKEEEEDIFDRGWNNLLPNRILLYCLKHEIEEDLGTPARDHIKFPGTEVKRSTVEEKMSKNKMLSDKQTTLADFGKNAPKGRTLNPLPSKQHGSTEKGKKKLASTRFPKERKKVVPSKVDASAPSLGDRLFDKFVNNGSGEKVAKQDRNESRVNRPSTDTDAQKKLITGLPELDADSKKRVLALMKNAASSVTMADIVKKHKSPSTHAYPSRNVVDKTITLGKVEGAVEAVRTAAKKLVNNCSIEDAKAVCEPGVLSQVFKWKNKLRIYLAPFLHGLRYTSFGRHFTKPEKLMEVVNILHWYVQSGDMIVDFCCGSNDFSCLMKKKLEETGKKCSYKNYDLFKPKNLFSFEQRDWMTVKPHELRKQGPNLIMGLNPPFGVKAALANKFIDKALEFEPKLIILIVPPETQRLDNKNPPYDLVWEDFESMGGKSFYLPGSVDDTDKPLEQWNATAPVLYLWSRRDFTRTHMAIAEKHGHLSRQQGSVDITMRQDVASVLQELQCPSNEASARISNFGTHNKQSEGSEDREAGGEGHKESPPSVRSETEALGAGLVNKLSEKRSNIIVYEEQMSEKGGSEMSTVETQGSCGLVKESENNSIKRKYYEEKLERPASENSTGEGHGTSGLVKKDSVENSNTRKYDEQLVKKDSERSSNKRKYDEHKLERETLEKSSGDSQKGKKLPRRSTPMPSPSKTGETGYQYHAAADDDTVRKKRHDLDTGRDEMRYPKHSENRYARSDSYFESSAQRSYGEQKLERRTSDNTTAFGHKGVHGKFPDRPSPSQMEEIANQYQVRDAALNDTSRTPHIDAAGYGDLRSGQHSEVGYPQAGSYLELSYDEHKLDRRISEISTVEGLLGGNVPRKLPEMPSPLEMREPTYPFRSQGTAASHTHQTQVYGGNLDTMHDDMNRRHDFDTRYEDTNRHRQQHPEIGAGGYFESPTQPSYGTSRYMGQPQPQPQPSYGGGSRSVMDRYAPLLNELNQEPMMGCFGYESQPQHPGSAPFQVDPMDLGPPHGAPLPGTGFAGEAFPDPRQQPASEFALGFAPGPQQHPYGHPYSSAGWMND